jgi:ADP-sugar diphosphatase
MAASFVMIHGREVPVELDRRAQDISVEECVKSKLLLDWAASIDSDLLISHVFIQSIDYFGKRIGFMKIVTNASRHGAFAPGICFLRGGSVSILVILQCEGEDWVVCTRQVRVPVGAGALLELPAGMVDEAGELAGVAVKELEEEVGIILKKGDLTDMTELAWKGRYMPRGAHPSPGGSDEFIRFFLHKRSVTREQLDAMRGKATGNIEEGETIVLDLIPRKDLWKMTTDMKALSSMLLYQQLTAEGLIV